MHLSIISSLSVSLLASTILADLLRLRADSPSFPEPSDDAFYVAPKNLDSFRPGDIIRSRPVNTTISSKAKASYQVLYRTTDTMNNPEATVATIWQPFVPKTPQQILSHQAYMDSDSFDCSPSYAWVNTSDSDAKDTILVDASMSIRWALKHGLYAVSPDSEGPKAAFFAGFQAGKATLDGIRATRNFFNLPKNVGVGMMGYSGGAATTVWAENLAMSYAPDINIIGSTHGGTPIDPRHILMKLQGGLYAGMATAGLVGLMNAYPALYQYIYSNIDSTTRTKLEPFTSRNYCLNDVFFKNIFTNVTKILNIPNLLDQPIPAAIMARESLLMNVSSVGVGVPTFPRYIYHGRFDEVTPFSDIKQYIMEQCSHGANIRFNIYNIAEHKLTSIQGLDGAVDFMEQVFDGTTTKVACGTDDAISND